MREGTVHDITGARAAFTEGFSRFDRWAEAYTPRDQALFEAAAQAMAGGSFVEAAYILNQGGRLQEAIGVDDLPVLLGATMRTRLMAAYDAVSQPWRTLVNVDNLPDLERWDVAGTLFSSDDGAGNATPNNLIPEVPEHMGYDEAKLSEAYEYAQLKTFGIVWSVSRRALLADNLRAINNMSRDVGIAMRRTENWHFVNTLALTSSTTVSGKLLRDGVNLFAVATTRGNMISGAYALEAADLSAQIILFGAQTDRNGVTNDKNGIKPKYLIVPPALEETAWNLVSPAARISGTATPTTSDNYFKFLEVVCIPELTSSADWYLAADPRMFPGVNVGYLNGRQEPEYFTQLENVNLAEADGTRQKIRHDFGFWAEQWHTWRKIDVTG